MFNRFKKFFELSRTAIDSTPQPGHDESDIAALPADDCEAHKRRGDLYLNQNKLDDAAQCYRKALSLDPLDPKVHRTLGLVLNELGRHEDAQHHLQEALSLAPSLADARHGLGAVLLAQGKIDDSIAQFQMALELDSRLAIAYRDLCFALAGQGKTDDAKQVIITGMKQCPDFADLPYYLGNVHVQEKQYEEALVCYNQALVIRPDYAEVHFNCGIALQYLNRNEEALTSYDKALELDCQHRAETLCRRGLVLGSLRRDDEALKSLDDAIALKPDFAEAHNGRGVTLQRLKKLEESLTSIDRALELKPDYAEALCNRGITLQYSGRHEEGLANVEQALKIKPDFAEALVNRGAILQNLGQYHQALACYEKAIQLKPDLSDAHNNEGMCRLLLGDFVKGWEKYESRWHVGKYKGTRPKFEQPLWLGKEPLQGKTILLYAEQGLGDTLQFCRYAKLVAAQGATVLLAVQSPLTSLLADLEGVHMIYAIEDREALPAFDYHCPLLSLPLAFNTQLGTIPSGVPYLRSDPDRVRRWQIELGDTDLPRIGVVWSGNPIHGNDHNRSIALADFIQVVSPRAQFISLQKDVRSNEKPMLAARSDILHVGDAIEDFMDTAALVELMDLVIAVDTSVAHLAGALGKPLWLLLPFNVDWRWLLDRDDNPWYPSARLFRQPLLGDWAPVLATVAAELQEFAQDITKKVKIA